MLADKFEALLTVDQNLPFQQNLRACGLGVVVAVTRTNRVKELRRLMPKILEALNLLKPGELITVGG